MAKLIERLGRVNKNKFGTSMEVVEYKNANHIRVRFEQGNIVKTSWLSFCKGKVSNPLDKVVYGIGFLGEGKYKTCKNNKTTSLYITWHGMLRRGYDERYKEKRPTYKDCTVCEEWHNFQKFAEWYEENYYSIEGARMEIDKDILQKGNKVYSPETCIFVPSEINTLFAKSYSSRGNHPIGVSYSKQNNKYKVQCSIGKENVFVGYFDTPEEAFEAYKTKKESVFKQIAEFYKEFIPVKLYEAMLKYTIEVND